jgi:hypothetical protein
MPIKKFIFCFAALLILTLTFIFTHPAFAANLRVSGGFDTTRQQTVNVLKNGSFESWSHGADFAPDGWSLWGDGIDVSKETSVKKLGAASVKVARNGADCRIQILHTESWAGGIDYMRGRTYTFSCWAYATVGNRVRIGILNPGSGWSYSDYHPGDSTWQLLSTSVTVNDTAGYLAVACYVDSGDTSGYFDGAMFVEGTAPFAYIPHPDDEYLQAISYQNETTKNNNYGLLSMECGETVVPVSSGTKQAYAHVAFGTAFSKVLVVVGELQDAYAGGVYLLCCAHNPSTSGFNIYIYPASTTGAKFSRDGNAIYRWIAIGVK